MPVIYRKVCLDRGHPRLDQFALREIKQLLTAPPDRPSSLNLLVFRYMHMIARESLIFLLSASACYFLLANATYSILLIFSWLDLKKKKDEKQSKESKFRSLLTSGQAPACTIIIPAFNEQDVIVESISSYLSLNYPNYQILVVDDGSQDKTFEVLREAFNLEPTPLTRVNRISRAPITGTFRSLTDSRLWLIRQNNHGKAAALNLALDYINSEFCCTADADTIPETACLQSLMGAFTSESGQEIVAAGGTVRIANGASYGQHRILHGNLPRSPLLVFQIIEYIRAFYCGRSGWEWMQSTVLLSGALAAFRVSALKEVGGFDTKSITEDLEIILRFRWQSLNENKKWVIRLIPDPLCWTQAPSSLKTLRRQRIRWQQGLSQTMWKYFSLILNPTYGLAGFFHLPYILIFEWIGPWVELMAYFLVLTALYLKILNPYLVGSLVVFGLAYSVIVSIIAIHLEESRFARHHRGLSAFRFALGAALENFGYRQLTWLYRLEGMIRLPFQQPSWGRQDRHSVAEEEKSKNSRAA